MPKAGPEPAPYKGAPSNGGGPPGLAGPAPWRSRAAQIALVFSMFTGAALGASISAGSGAPSSAQRTQATRAATAAATAVATTMPTAAAAPKGRTAAFDPCTLVTTSEAGAILEKQVTADSGPPPSAQCLYRPQPAALWQWPDLPMAGQPARLRIDDVIVTVITGRGAAARYDAKQARFGRDSLDRQVSGLGDKAIIASDELSVLHGSVFISVGTRSERDFGPNSRTPYMPVHEKYFGVLEAFARPALQRVVGQVATAPAAAATTVAAQPPVLSASEAPAASPSPADRIPGAVAGGIAGLALGALALFAVASRKPASGPGREHVMGAHGDLSRPVVPEPAIATQVEQPSLPPAEVFTQQAPVADGRDDESIEALDPGPTKGIDISAMEALASRPPEKMPPTGPPVDTGHYDDGHAFGWDAGSAAGANGSPTVTDDTGVEQPVLPPTEVFTPPPRPRTMERPDPCKDQVAQAEQLLAQLQSAREENRRAMQRALTAFFGRRSSAYNEGYAHYVTITKVTAAVQDASKATAKVLIDVALFAAGGWGGIAGKGSKAAGVLGEGIAGAKSVGDAWGKVGVKVAGKVADAYIGDKAGTMGAGTYKFVEKAIGEHGEDATKAFQGPAGAIESIVRDKVIDALGDWMKEGAMAADLARARAAYADFFGAAAVANTMDGAARELKRQIDEINARLRLYDCPEVLIPDHVLYTFDLTGFGEGMFEGQTGPTMRTKNLMSGRERTTDLFAKINDTGSLPF